MNNKIIRKSVIQSRKALDTARHAEDSVAICKKIMTLPEYTAAKCVLAYYPINNEVDIRPLLDDILRHKSLALPRIGSNSYMHSAKISNLGELTRGVFNTLEPNPSCSEIPLSDIDVVIVPLVAFDECCSRIGYGGGYYDRFLAGGRFYKIGAAFEMQRIEILNCGVHDVKMDVIVTEKNIYLPRS